MTPWIMPKSKGMREFRVRRSTICKTEYVVDYLHRFPAGGSMIHATVGLWGSVDAAIAEMEEMDQAFLKAEAKASEAQRNNA